MPIIDSSTLISLAKIRRLRILSLLKGKIITLPEVYEECVEKGLLLGYADAIRIKELFDQKTITIEACGKYEKCSGVSEIDSKVISLAKEKQEHLFVDDAKLGRRAKAEHIAVRTTPDILLQLLWTRRMAWKEFVKALGDLVRAKRMSEETKQAYERAGGRTWRK